MRREPSPGGNPPVLGSRSSRDPIGRGSKPPPRLRSNARPPPTSPKHQRCGGLGAARSPACRTVTSRVRAPDRHICHDSARLGTGQAVAARCGPRPSARDRPGAGSRARAERELSPRAPRRGDLLVQEPALAKAGGLPSRRRGACPRESRGRHAPERLLPPQRRLKLPGRRHRTSRYGARLASGIVRLARSFRRQHREGAHHQAGGSNHGKLQGDILGQSRV